MDLFTLLYAFYCAKIVCQASIYFIWLADSSFRGIEFIAAAVAVFGTFPFFHVIVHIFSAKPLSSPAFIVYLCSSLLLAFLWYKPTQDGSHAVIPFGLVTTFDLLAFFLFCLRVRIYPWTRALKSDVEQGHQEIVQVRPTRLADPAKDDFQTKSSDTELRQLGVLQELGSDTDALDYSGLDLRSPLCSDMTISHPQMAHPCYERVEDKRPTRLKRGGVLAGGEGSRGVPVRVAGLKKVHVEDGTSGLLLDRRTHLGASSNTTPAVFNDDDVHPALRSPQKMAYHLLKQDQTAPVHGQMSGRVFN